MRKQIAAANWKMNCRLEDATSLLKSLAAAEVRLSPGHEVIIGVPYPYLLLAKEYLEKETGYFVSAQNCYTKDAGAYTGEVSAGMLASCGISHVILGHSERREYFGETNPVLAEKVDQALKNNLIPIFCCGETLDVREKNMQNDFVAGQIRESLFHLPADQISKIVIAYEPIWAIGTGKTATSDQAQEMHAHIRQVISERYGESVANEIPVLYGGSVKAANAAEIFGKPDVDGGLVGGASLNADEFSVIINSLK